MKLKERMNKKIQKPKSVRSKLFLSLCIVIVLTIIFLIIINNIVLETFYIYNKKDIEKNLYEQINTKFNNNESPESIKDFVKEQSAKNNLDICVTNTGKESYIVSNQFKINNIDNIRSAMTFSQKKKLGE